MLMTKTCPSRDVTNEIAYVIVVFVWNRPRVHHPKITSGLRRAERSLEGTDDSPRWASLLDDCNPNLGPLISYNSLVSFF